MTKISDKAMLVRLLVSKWSARKFDRDATREVAESHGTSEDAGRYNKLLIAKETTEVIERISGAARTFHYANTLPWLDDGYRILPAKNYFEYTAKISDFRDQFERAVSTFSDGYEDFVENARIKLNGLFKESDYPSREEIEQKFALDARFMPIPEAGDFRVHFNVAEEQRIRTEIEKATQAAFDGAVKDLWQRIHGAVKHMSERLRNYTGKRQGTFHASMVENLRELVDVLPRLNILGDADLHRATERLRDELCQFDAVELKADAKLRKQVQKSADEILKAMEGYVS